MDLILFNPPRYRSGRHHKFNNALLWLASYLRKRSLDVRIVPLNHEGFAETVREEIALHKPRFAAISCKWWDTLYSSSHIASLIKQSDPDITTISGGPTATFFAKELVDGGYFDIVVRGDGEEPLHRLLTDQAPVNCVFRNQGTLQPMRSQYVQTEEDLQRITLVDDLEEVLSDTSVVSSYIWTGKGCTEMCVYCSANAWNNMESFGRARFIYRPLPVIEQEIEILSKYPGSSRIIFDFDPHRGPVQEKYYVELFSRLPRKKYNCYFYSWSLPSQKLVDTLAETFNFVELCIDVQTCSERLRRLLGDQRFLKAFFSDEALEDVLNHCHQYDNFMIDLSTLMGLPFEQPADVTQIKVFSDHFYDKFEELRYPYVSPMNVEPGSLLMRHPDRYDMVLLRQTFSDFMRYTKRSFENNINCYQPEDYSDGVFHPLGSVPKDDYENGDMFRVYETWKEVQANVDRRSNERTLTRARAYMRFGLIKAGIRGGIDRPTFGDGEAE